MKKPLYESNVGDEFFSDVLAFGINSIFKRFKKKEENQAKGSDKYYKDLDDIGKKWDEENNFKPLFPQQLIDYKIRNKDELNIPDEEINKLKKITDVISKINSLKRNALTAINEFKANPDEYTYLLSALKNMDLIRKYFYEIPDSDDITGFDKYVAAVALYNHIDYYMKKFKVDEIATENPTPSDDLSEEELPTEDIIEDPGDDVEPDQPDEKADELDKADDIDFDNLTDESVMKFMEENNWSDEKIENKKARDAKTLSIELELAESYGDRYRNYISGFRNHSIIAALFSKIIQANPEIDKGRAREIAERQLKIIMKESTDAAKAVFFHTLGRTREHMEKLADFLNVNVEDLNEAYNFRS